MRIDGRVKEQRQILVYGVANIDLTRINRPAVGFLWQQADEWRLVRTVSKAAAQKAKDGQSESEGTRSVHLKLTDGAGAIEDTEIGTLPTLETGIDCKHPSERLAWLLLLVLTSLLLTICL